MLQKQDLLYYQEQNTHTHIKIFFPYCHGLYLLICSGSTLSHVTSLELLLTLFFSCVLIMFVYRVYSSSVSQEYHFRNFNSLISLPKDLHFLTRK